MHPITIHTEGGAPSFDADPIAWFSWARQRLRDGSHERVVECPPTVYHGRDGHRWRVIRTDGGIEIRPDLGVTFLRETHTPQITAIQIAERVTVELASVEGRWAGEYDLDELDLAELGRAMLEERRLPHDNLRFLFGRTE